MPDEKMQLSDVNRNQGYWTGVMEHSNSILIPVSTTAVSLCCPLICPPISVARPFTLIDFSWVLQDIQAGYSPEQASRQRGVDQHIVSKACVELLRLGNMALRARGELRGQRLKDPRAALVALDLDMSRARHAKLQAWCQHLDQIPIPQMSIDVWESWEDAKWGIFIQISRDLRADLWLGFLASLQFPTSKMVIKQVPLEPQQKADLEACVLLSLVEATTLSPAVVPRSVPVEPHGGRPDVYLHIANEDEKVTDHTGAAFETGGLEALMLVIRLVSVAVHGRLE